MGNQSDSFIILGLFVFLGVFAFFGSMMFASIPDSSLDGVNVTRPTMPTNETDSDILSFVGYATSSLGSLASTNPAVFAIIVVPFLVVLTFILIKLAKPFGS